MNGPIRVLELRSVRGTGGGPEKTILLGARHADPARFAVTVCYIRDARDRDFLIDQRARPLGVDYVEILERNSFDPGVWSALRALIRQRRIDILHAHEYKTNVLAWLLAKAEHVVPLSTVHGWFGRDTWKERVYYAIDKRVLARYPRLVAVSSALKQELVRTGTRADLVTVVPNGIDPRAFRRDPAKREPTRAELGLAPDEIVVGAVGRLERQKRFDLLMEAVARLLKAWPRLRLVIAGDGGLKQDLEALRAQLDLGDRCLLLGHQHDIPRLHHALDLFVQASDHEGSPNVVLEAMALETPIVTTDAGGTADLVTDGEHGIVIRPGEIEALCGGIGRVLNDWPAARARAAAARRRVETELSFDGRMEKVEAIYAELVGAR